MNRLQLLVVALATAVAAGKAMAQINPQRQPTPILPRPILANAATACLADRGTALTRYATPLPALAGRDLNGQVTWSSNMTNDQCRAACASKGFVFAGTQSGDFCFCGNNAGLFGLAPQCGDVCGGRPGEACGGTLANSVSLSGASGLPPTTVP